MTGFLMQVPVVVVFCSTIWSCHHLSQSSSDSRTCSGALCGFSTLPSSNICFYVMFFSIMSSQERKLKPHRLYWFFVSKPLCRCTGEPLRRWSDTRSWWLFPLAVFLRSNSISHFVFDSELWISLPDSSIAGYHRGTLCHWYLSFTMLCDSLLGFFLFFFINDLVCISQTLDWQWVQSKENKYNVSSAVEQLTVLKVH